MGRGLVLLLLAAACSAHFVDERPASEREAARTPDLAGLDLDFSDAGVVVGRGRFAGRDGHLGVGGASLFQRDDGLAELRFDEQFACSDVPGPVVVLTTRDSLGTRVDPSQGDLPVGPLQASSGAQRYLIVSSLGGRRRVFIYCKPYGLEVAVAGMESP